MELRVIKESILKSNENYAQKIRALLNDQQILMVNFISSPGSGKTSLLEKIIPLLKDKGIDVAVIEGDCYTTKDGERIKALDVPITQINTQGGCHLEAYTIHQALTEQDLTDIDVIFIENVGNLVCPTEFDLGEDYKIAVLSTAEGNDKPLKYPMLFRDCPITILNKIDLIPYTDFDINNFRLDLQKINNNSKIFLTSCRTGEGIQSLVDYFNKQLKK